MRYVHTRRTVVAIGLLVTLAAVAFAWIRSGR
jgi:hypothetical protein